MCREPRCKIRCLCLVFCWTRQCPHMFCFSNGPAEAVSWWRAKCMNPPHGKEKCGFWADFGWCFHPVWWIWMNFAWISIPLLPLHNFGWSIFFPGVRRFCPGSAAKASLRTPCGHHPFQMKVYDANDANKERDMKQLVWLSSHLRVFLFLLLLFSSPGDSRKHRSFLYQPWVVGTHVMYACLEDEALAILWAGRKVCKQHIVALKALTNAEFLKSQQV